MYIGIDAGTSGIKAVLVDDAQQIIGTARASLTSQSPHDGWSEQDPEAWWNALLDVMDQLHRAHPSEMASVRGIGLSGQQHGAVLLDEDRQCLRPCILWNDVRSEAECRIFEERFPRSRDVTGNLAMPGFTAPKLIWVQKHEPDIFARTRYVLLPKAWLRLRLSGEMIEDMSDASGSLWLDVGARRWSEEALNACGLSIDAMPRLCEGTEPAGVLKDDLARRWGMRVAPVIAGSAGDNAASAVGLGAVKTGDAFVSLGTSGVVWCTTDRFRPNADSSVHAFCHAIPGKWHQMGVTLSAAASLAWWSDIVGKSERELLAELPEKIERPSRAIFLPYLAGERTPHNDAHVRGAFLGLDKNMPRSELTQAVLEGVAYSLRDAQDAMTAAGTRFETADVVGGGAQSRQWVEILASVLGVRLSRLAQGEQGGAYGAARLGRLASTAEDVTTICQPPERLETIEPSPLLEAAYGERQSRYRALYEAATAFNRLG